MMLLESFKMALSNIRASKMRSFLTMLGIIIGVAAVIVIVGLGNGMSLYITGQFEELGTNLLSVNIVGRGSRSLNEEEMYRIIEDDPVHFSQASPTVTMNSPVKVGSEFSTRTSVNGVNEIYPQIRGWTISQGRWFSYVEVLRRGKVCVVGSYIAKEYFNGVAAGQTIRIGGNPFTVLGVLSEQADSTQGSADDAVYVPNTTAARLSGMGRPNSYSVTIPDVDNATASKEALENALYQIFHDEDAYFVVSMAEMLDTMNQMLGVMIGVLALIAGISLVVGGIGIMNIMLVSVSERTREIGVRKALGAKERYIMSQFVVEAATTSALGGALGILLGELLSSAASFIVSAATQEAFSVVPSVGSIMLAAGISIGIGVLFGYLPAKKAAQLNPIDALRYE